MSDSAISERGVNRAQSAAMLNASARLWFLVTLAGQWVFVAYIVSYFVISLLSGGLDILADTHLPNGFIAGDSIGNVAVAAHLFLAVIIIGAGPLQLIPQIRAGWPVFHRWNGRFYMAAVTLTSVAGLFMVWTRGTVGDLSQHIAISLDGVLILVFAALALKTAIAKNIAAHRRWALRLFMVASAVWFYRLGLMGWLVANGGPVGFDMKTFTGPFLSFLSFGQYLVPLAILELYLRARDGKSTAGKFAMAGGLFAITAIMSFGIFAATMALWLPRL